MKAADDEIYFLDAVGGIDASKVSVERVEKAPTFNREQRRRMQKAFRKRGKGFTR